MFHMFFIHLPLNMTFSPPQALSSGAFSEMNFWYLAEDDFSYAQLLAQVGNEPVLAPRPNLAVFRLLPFVRETDCPFHFTNYNLTYFFKVALKCKVENIPVIF